MFVFKDFSPDLCFVIVGLWWAGIGGCGRLRRVGERDQGTDEEAVLDASSIFFFLNFIFILRLFINVNEPELRSRDLSLCTICVRSGFRFCNMDYRS